MFGIKKTKYTDLTDESLMDLLSKGNRQAFESVYDRYFLKLLWFAKGFVKEEDLAHDVVQEIFIKIIEKPEQFNTNKKFSTWVYVLTANLAKQHLRNSKNRTRILEENLKPILERTTAAVETLDLKWLKERVMLICNELSEKEKNIYRLRFEQDLSIKEIAEILNIPEGSVKSGVFYLLKKFAYQLKDFSHE